MTVNSNNSIRSRVWEFFEHPRTVPAIAVQVVIATLIVLSGVEFMVELFNRAFFEAHRGVFGVMETVIVVAFTVEYVVRFWATPHRGKFFINFYSIVDLLAILPFFFIQLNLSAFRVARVVRIVRMVRVIRVAKMMKYSSGVTITHIIQENVIKNMFVLIAVLYFYEPLKVMIAEVPREYYPDILIATSVLAVAALFGVFAISYGEVDPNKVGDRILTHLTSGALNFPIGIMFLIIQIILRGEIGKQLDMLVLSIWFIYFSIILWDFWNVKRIEKNLEQKQLVSSGGSVGASNNY